MVGNAVILRDNPETSSDSEELPPVLSEEAGPLYENSQISNEPTSSTSKRKYTFIMRSRGSVIKCEFCSRQFHYPSKYKEHLRIHTGERPFKCPRCPMTFTQKGAMNSHLKIHERSTAVCQVCQMAFRTDKLLQKHMLLHDPKPLLDPPNTVIVPVETVESQPVYFEEEPHVSKTTVVYEPETTIVEEYEFEDAEPVHEEVESVQMEGAQRWQVDHVPQVFEEGIPQPESVLHLVRLADGRLLINDVFVEGERYPEENVTIYYYTLSNGKILNFLYDEQTNVLEVFEPDQQENDLDQFQSVHDFENPGSSEGYFSNNAEFDIYDEAIVEEESVFEDIYDSMTQRHQRVKPDPELLEPPFKMPGGIVLADKRPPKNSNKIEEAPLVPVDERIVKLAAPVTNYSESIPRRIRRMKYKKNKNLEWVINAIAEGKNLDEANPHKRRKPSVYKCPHCELVVKYPSKIEAHKRTHTGEKPFECEICHQKFAMKTTMRMHIRRHLNQKMYACTFDGCKKTFISGSLLMYHIRTRHMERRRFACLRGCGACFFSDKDRERHQEICQVMDLEHPIYEFHEDVIYADKIVYQQEENFHNEDEQYDYVNSWGVNVGFCSN